MPQPHLYRSSNGNYTRSKPFQKFIKELKRIYNEGHRFINTDQLYALIRTCVGKKSKEEERRFNYHWIKFLEEVNVIEQDLKRFGWIITEEILEWK